jgi:hypothetical protein
MPSAQRSSLATPRKRTPREKQPFETPNDEPSATCANTPDIRPRPSGTTSARPPGKMCCRASKSENSVRLTVMGMFHCPKTRARTRPRRKSCHSCSPLNRAHRRRFHQALHYHLCPLVHYQHRHASVG